jgi:hypothetical protein
VKGGLHDNATFSSRFPLTKLLQSEIYDAREGRKESKIQKLRREEFRRHNIIKNSVRLERVFFLINYPKYIRFFWTKNLVASLNNQISSLISHHLIITSHLSPLTSHLSTLTSYLSPLTSHLSPLTSHALCNCWLFTIITTSHQIQKI